MASKLKNITVSPVTDADGISTTQTPAAGGAQELTITGALASGGKVVLDSAHLVTITSAADDTGRTFTVTGLDSRGQLVTDAITGVNGAAATGAVYFLEVTSISTDADTAGAVTAGTAGKCVSPWYLPSLSSEGIALSGEISTGGGMTFGVQHTLDDLQVLANDITALDHSTVTALTASADGNYQFIPRGIRAIVTAYTSGTLQFNLVDMRGA